MTTNVMLSEEGVEQSCSLNCIKGLMQVEETGIEISLLIFNIFVNEKTENHKMVCCAGSRKPTTLTFVDVLMF